MVSSPKYKVDISPHSVSIGYLHAATFLCTYFNVVYSNESTEKPEFIHPSPSTCQSYVSAAGYPSDDEGWGIAWTGLFFLFKKAFQVTGMLSDIKLLKGHSSVSFWFYSWVCSTQNNPLSSSEVSICLFADFKIRMWGWRWLEPKCSLNENEKNFHTSSEKMMQKRLIITDIYLFIWKM